MQFPHLFLPITINGMTLKNRAVMPPMGTGYGNSDNTVSDRLVAYIAQRA
jgi:2,4-dienoyl-CoA reductase-like NADH-dependent reductase (Old Yellow Enzyme family)